MNSSQNFLPQKAISFLPRHNSKNFSRSLTKLISSDAVKQPKLNVIEISDVDKFEE